MERQCKQCLQIKTLENFEPRGQFFRGICRSCVSKNIKQKIFKTRIYLNSLKDECSICGYNKCSEALDFHHLDPSIKCFNIGTFAGKRAFSDKTKELIDLEVSKCILLCANCHREYHAGLLTLDK